MIGFQRGKITQNNITLTLVTKPCIWNPVFVYSIVVSEYFQIFIIKRTVLQSKLQTKIEHKV